MGARDWNNAHTDALSSNSLCNVGLVSVRDALGVRCEVDTEVNTLAFQVKAKNFMLLRNTDSDRSNQALGETAR